MMPLDMQNVLDRAAIKDVLDRYCRGIDRLDADLVNSVYWPEAVDDHGIYKGPGKDFAAFVLPLLRDNYRVTMHTLGQTLIEISGARANSETYFVAYHVGEKEGRNFIETAGGRYVDVLEKRAGEWRIRDRVVVIEWTRLEDDAKEMAMSRTLFVPGKRDRTDVAYGR
jgi:SnoaL-like domain